MSIDAAAVSERGRALWARTFSAVHVPNYRRYLKGQLISLIGTWMQMTALALLVLRLTGSGTDLGLVIGLQTLPILLLGPYAGVLVDRIDKRSAMVVSQAVMGLSSALVAVLALTGTVTIWLLFCSALIFGLANSIANPARQTFVLEMVGPDDLRNAVTLNTVLVNVARAVGPAIAAILIAVLGIGWCFVGDAVSYVVVIATLVTLDTAELHPTPHVARAKGQLREGLTYVRRTPAMLIPLLMMTVVGMLTYEFQVSLPLMSQYTFHGNATTYGVMTASMGVGAIIGGLAAAGRVTRKPTGLARSSLSFGAVVLLAAVAPYLWLEVIFLALVGGASVTFLSLANASLQLQADPAMRGRVMALWSVAFLGTTPLGSPVIGAVGDNVGPRYGLLIGGVAALVVGAIGYVALQAADAAEPGVPGSRTAPAGGGVGVAAPAGTGTGVAAVRLLCSPAARPAGKAQRDSVLAVRDG